MSGLCSFLCVAHARCQCSRYSMTVHACPADVCTDVKRIELCVPGLIVSVRFKTRMYVWLLSRVQKHMCNYTFGSRDRFKPHGTCCGNPLSQPSCAAYSRHPKSGQPGMNTNTPSIETTTTRIIAMTTAIPVYGLLVTCSYMALLEAKSL